MSKRDAAALGAGAAAPDDYVRLSAHPRAQRAIKRAKASGGLAGFALSFYLAQGHGIAPFETGVRALAGGIAGYVLIWMAAVMVWRQIAVAEYKAAAARRAVVRAGQRAEREELAAERKRAADEARAAAGR